MYGREIDSNKPYLILDVKHNLEEYSSKFFAKIFSTFSLCTFSVQYFDTNFGTLVVQRLRGTIKKTLQQIMLQRLINQGWNVGLAQREAQIAARETSKNLGLRALTSTDFLYSGSYLAVLFIG